MEAAIFCFCASAHMQWHVHLNILWWKHAAAPWLNTHHGHVETEQTVMRTKKQKDFIHHSWQKPGRNGRVSRNFCFSELVFCPSGHQRVHTAAAGHHVTICQRPCPFLRLGQIRKHPKQKLKLFRIWRFSDLGGKKSTCFFSFLAYLSFKVENRIEWCFQPIQVFYHQFISSTNTGRLFLSSGLNEVSCRCDLKERRKTRARLEVGK